MCTSVASKLASVSHCKAPSSKFSNLLRRANNYTMTQLIRKLMIIPYLIERCKALNAMIKELWRRQIEDEVEDFLFTNELVAHTLERVSGWSANGHTMPVSPRVRPSADTPLTLSSAAVGSHRTNQGPGTVPARPKPINSPAPHNSQLQSVWMNANWGQLAASHATQVNPRDSNALSSSPTEAANSNINNSAHESVKLPPLPSEQIEELFRLKELLEDYNRLLGQLFRSGKLSVYLNNPHRRRKLARFDSMIHRHVFGLIN